MKKLILAFLILMTPVIDAMADTVTIDTTGWTQEQKNMMQSAAVSLLAEDGVTYKSVAVFKNGLEIDSPSDDVLNILTSANLKAKGTQIINAAEQNRQVDVAKETAKLDELKTNEFSALDINEVDNEIDSLNSLDDIKNLLRELLKYIKAKE